MTVVAADVSQNLDSILGFSVPINILVGFLTLSIFFCRHPTKRHRGLFHVIYFVMCYKYHVFGHLSYYIIL